MSTNSQIAFAPLGNTVAITAASTAPTGVQARSLDSVRDVMTEAKGGWRESVLNF